MKLLVISILISLIGTSLAGYSLQELVDALKELENNNHAKKEFSELTVPDHNLALDLITAFNKRWDECKGKPNEKYCRDESGPGKDNNSIDLCINPNVCSSSSASACEYTCGKCKCEGARKRSFENAKDEELGLKLLHGFKKVMYDAVKN